MSHPVMLSLIAAMARNRVIGREGRLPWHLPEDLRHFRALTLGKPIIMGRRTSDSLGGPLPGRRNIVISRDPSYRPEGREVHASLEGAIAACAGEPEVMVIGGGEVYAQAISGASRIYLTIIDHDFEGDTVFPALDGAWNETARSTHRATAWDYQFLTLERTDQEPVLRSSRA